MLFIDTAIRLAASSLYVIIVVILTSSFTGERLMLNAEWSTTGYYDRAAVATDSKECSKIGTCV